MKKEQMKKIYNKLIKLQEKENDIMIRQNEREKGKSCFDTAMIGSKIFRKALKK